MGKIIYNKLVRDKIPVLIESSGKDFKTRIGTDEEYKEFLLNKLLEEVNELRVEPCIEELADILEVIDSVKKTFNYSDEDIKNVKVNKAKLRGGFDSKIILEYVEE